MTSLSHLCRAYLRLAALALAFVLSSCGAKTHDQETLGGESHFLQACGECAAGLECIGGICTRDCSMDQTVCEPLQGDSQCTEDSDVGAPICDVACSNNERCEAVSTEHRCEQGFCRLAADVRLDSPCEEGGVDYPLGATWNCSDGCNTCFCSEEGVETTLIACLDEEPGACAYEGETYQLGESWACSDGCNTCFCTEEGVGSTMVGCAATGDGCEYEGDTYAIGDVWMCRDGCNTCSCTEEGIRGTMIACPPQECEYAGTMYQNGESWPCLDGCNTCQCLGGQVASTMVDCQAVTTCQEAGNDYALGESWTCSDGCNQCTCTEDGVESTLIECEPLTEFCEVDGVTRMLGESFLCPGNGCTCICGDGGEIIETMVPCQAVCETEQGRVVAGSTVECNGGCTCTCQEDGTLSQDTTPCSLGARCTVDGEVYEVGDTIPSEDSCSECTCGEGGTVLCNENDCPEPSLTPPDEWSDCEDAACICEAIRNCEASQYTEFVSLGSNSARVCGGADQLCYFVVEQEVEGGVNAFDCAVPLGAELCTDTFTLDTFSDYCTPLYQCNVLLGEPACPANSCESHYEAAEASDCEEDCSEAGLTCCNGECINTGNDPQNCGACGEVCPADAPVCTGSCQAAMCEGDTTCEQEEQCCGTECCGSGEICCLMMAGPVFFECHESTDGSCPVGCPLCDCAAFDTPIATPEGERRIEELAVGDIVYTIDDGAIVEARVLEVRKTPVFEHEVVRVELASGRTLRISAQHPTADGSGFGLLRVGDELDGVPITGVVSVPYPHPYTYDILPDSDTGAYFAAGVAIGSTLLDETRINDAVPVTSQHSQSIAH